MFDGPASLLGSLALLINAVTTVGVLVRLRVSPDAYEGTVETFRGAAKQVLVRGAALAVLLTALLDLVDASPSAVGLGAEAIAPRFVAAGLAAGVGVVVASLASRAAVDRLGWTADSATWTTFWPDSTLEWAVYLPASWLSTTADATLYVAFVVGGLTTGTTPVAFGLVAVSAVLAGGTSAWEGPGTVVRSATVYLVVGVAFVLTRSWLVLAVAMLVNNVVHGLRDNTEARYGTAAAGD